MSAITALAASSISKTDLIDQPARLIAGKPFHIIVRYYFMLRKQGI